MTPSKSPLARRLLAGVAALLLVPGIASAQQACLQPAEKTAFDIRALQSQLLVAALACGQHDDYNAFVRKNQAELATAFRNLGSYFRRTAGAQHQRQLDQYITELANSQSRISIDRGSFFCREQIPLFQAAMAANGPAELSQVSVTRQVHQSLTAQACPAPAPRQGQQRASSQPAR